MLEDADEMDGVEPVIPVFEDAFDVPGVKGLLLEAGEVLAEFASESPMSELISEIGTEIDALVKVLEPNRNGEDKAADEPA